MRAANYDQTEMIGSEITSVNATSVLYVAEIARQRADRSEIERLKVTYLITDTPSGVRIAALAIHTQPGHAVSATPGESVAAAAKQV
jgi:hypothetical protein